MPYYQGHCLYYQGLIMLEVVRLYYDYAEQPVLCNVNLSLNSGTLLHIQGENGAGKTTLLKLLAGLFEPDSGYISYNACNINVDLPAYQALLCYIGHAPGISGLLTVQENLSFNLWDIECQQFQETMRLLSLDKLADIRCHVLSMGQRRRVALARLFLTKAPLWLLDEPLTGIDQDAVKLLMRCFETHLTRGGQIIVTSHQNLPVKTGAYEVCRL